MASSRKIEVEVEKIENGKSMNSIEEYELRGLKDNEIPTWAKYCASIFAYKANPPPASYFERHYYNDPNRGNANLIRVITYRGNIVSSCRIFLKTLSTGRKTTTTTYDADAKATTTIEGGGIGEVCTSPEHRKRGLSKILLQDALHIMRTSTSCRVSLLHAAPMFFPVYERGGGYATTLSSWSLATIKAKKLLSLLSPPTSNNTTTMMNFRLAEFPRDTKRLRSLHQKYSEQRFVGCIIRSEDYWNDYLSKEIKIYTISSKTEATNDDDDSSGILAWMSLRPRGMGRMQLVEFGYDIGNRMIEKESLWKLLAYTYQQQQSQQQSDNNTEIIEDIKLHLPTHVLDEILEHQSSDDDIEEEDNERCITSLSSDNTIILSVEESNDLGWMYVTLPKKEGDRDDNISIDMIEMTKKRPHLIWPSDSF